MQSYKIISWEIYEPVLVKFVKDELIKNNKYHHLKMIIQFSAFYSLSIKQCVTKF